MRGEANTHEVHVHEEVMTNRLIVQHQPVQCQRNGAMAKSRASLYHDRSLKTARSRLGPNLNHRSHRV